MATINKDFVVKNGLVVGQGAVFGDTVTIPDPTADSHAATKSYVDSIASSGGSSASVIVSSTEPSSKVNGLFWLDTTIEKLKVYLSDDWITIASIDYGAISGNIFYSYFDGGRLSLPEEYILDGGEPGTASFDAQVSSASPDSELFLAIIDGGATV